MVGRDLRPVHRHAVEAGQLRVGQPVLQAERDAAGGRREAPVGVELAEDEGGDLHGEGASRGVNVR